jgi:hypothetical protein
VGRGSQTSHPYYEGEPIPLPEKRVRRVKSGPGRAASDAPKPARAEPPAVPQLPKRLWPKPDRRAQRRVDSIGNISFASAVYNVGRAYSGGVVEAFTVEGVVHIALDGRIVKHHDAVHTPEQEEAALRRKRPSPSRAARRRPRTMDVDAGRPDRDSSRPASRDLGYGLTQTQRDSYHREL